MMNRKLFFGKPCPLLAIESLAANLELDQLKHMLHESLDEYSERAEGRHWFPSSAPIDIHNRLREVAADLYKEELYGDQMDYQASILRRCTKLYKKGTALLVDPPCHVDSVKRKAQGSDVRDFDDIYKREYDLSNCSFEEMVEKLVILTHMFSTEPQMYVNHGSDAELIENLWNGHFSDKSEQFASAFRAANQPYRERLYNF